MTLRLFLLFGFLLFASLGLQTKSFVRAENPTVSAVSLALGVRGRVNGQVARDTLVHTSVQNSLIISARKYLKPGLMAEKESTFLSLLFKIANFLPLREKARLLNVCSCISAITPAGE